MQCTGYHDLSECQTKSSNQRYIFYENVRKKFAKDVGFNYRKSYEDRSLPPGHLRTPTSEHSRKEKYDERRIEYGRDNWDSRGRDQSRYTNNKRTYNEFVKDSRDYIDYYREEKRAKNSSPHSNGFRDRLANDPRLKNQQPAYPPRYDPRQDLMLDKQNKAKYPKARPN